jgi:hypothetical protein
MRFVKSWIGLFMLFAVSMGVGNAATQAAPSEFERQDALPTGLKIQPDRVAVAGISSGGFMATQLQLAYPETFPLAAVLAGGPYDCVKVTGGMLRCLSPGTLSKTQVQSAVKLAVQNARQHRIGDLTLLDHGKLYDFYGADDNTVGTNIEGAVATFYQTLKATLNGTIDHLQIDEDGKRPFGHTFPTILPPDGSGDCINPISPYLGHCGLDGAKKILEHLYPDVTTGPQPTSTSGIIRMYRSKTFSAPSNGDIGDNLYIYTPQACADGAPCGLLLALHGCRQNDSAIGAKFVLGAGFNRWADDYRLIVVYPQTASVEANYDGCWDWWGYTGAGFDTRAAPQLNWLNSLVKQLMSH